MFQRLLLVTCVVVLAWVPLGARADSEAEFGMWSALFITGQLHAKAPGLMAWFDTQGRREANRSAAVFRPGIGYQVQPWMSVWGGYAWVPVFADATGTRADEHQTWEQLTLEYRRIPGFLFQSRTRLEQRFGSGDIGYRYRQAARFNYQPKSSFPLGVILWDEVFLGAGARSHWKNGFDQNRLFAGPAFFAADGAFRAEVGYQSNYLARAVDRTVHLLVVNLFVSLQGKNYRPTTRPNNAVPPQALP